MTLNKKTLVAALTAIAALVAVALKFAQSLPDATPEVVHDGAPATVVVDAGAPDAGK